MTTSIETDQCVVCGAIGGARSRFDGLVRQCTVCTFNWTSDDLPTTEELYVPAYFKGGNYRNYYNPPSRRFESGLRLNWLLSTGRPSSLLEVGCAAGFFVEAARSAGIDARGVEVSAHAVDYARKTLAVPVQHETFESTSFEQEFDAVCAFHVLEHVEDPVDFVTRARRALKPGGRIALEVPNIASAAAGRLGSSWSWIQPQYHRWHFTPESLNRLVVACGLEVIDQDTVFARFYWRRWMRSLRFRQLLLKDLAASRSLRITHPGMGDCLRIVARVPGTSSMR